MHPVEKAVSPLREDAITRAEEGARLYIAMATADLEEHKWDINAAAPYPRGMGYGLAHYMARERHDNFWRITKQDPKLGYQSSNGHKPVYVVMDDEGIERFVKARKDDAAAQYDAFVAKLVKKTGEVKAASLEGNHVWGCSILTVTLADDTTQRWKTQQIENYSKYGKHFNQWPTRKMKEKVA